MLLPIPYSDHSPGLLLAKFLIFEYLSKSYFSRVIFPIALTIFLHPTYTHLFFSSISVLNTIYNAHLFIWPFVPQYVSPLDFVTWE